MSAAAAAVRCMRIGESVSEMLDWVPAQLRVLRITRPKYACRTCDTVAQAPAPERPIAGGLATPALLAQVLVSKYCDHTPLYRQSQIFARHGVDLGRSTLAGWVGGACWWLEALHERLRKHVFASDHLFADDTPIPVLDPGRGRTKTGRLWVYARDQRPWADPRRRRRSICSRRTERPSDRCRISSGFKGVLHVDGYAGFERLTGNGDIILAACWAHTRRKFYEVAEATDRRWRPRRCAGSASSMRSKRTCAGSRRPIGSLRGAPLQAARARSADLAGGAASAACPAAARLPRRSATRSRAGMG